MKRFLLIVTLLLQYIVVLGQWSTLGSGFDYPGRCMIWDSTTQVLIVGGNFTQAGGIISNGIAAWDGTSWHPFGNGAPYGAPVYSIAIYKGDLYASSVFISSPTHPNWFCKWNGIAWDTLSPALNSAIGCFKENNNDLYIGGSFARSTYSILNLIAKFDGTTLYPIPLPAQTYSVNAIEFYHGDMFIGGNFFDTLQQVNDLEVWDGISFRPFGINGLAGGPDNVNAMAVYNDELYIGGWFTTAIGDPANFIMSWDGTQFHDVGGGLNGPAFRLKVYDDGLYVCGTFTMAGQLPVPGIVKWDGSQWISLCDTFQNYGITEFIKVGNDLYISGGFNMIDTLHANYVAKYTLPLSVAENQTLQSILLSPNPVNEHLNIKFQSCIMKECMLHIFNPTGQLIHHQALAPGTKQLEISTATWPAGLYLVQVQTEKGSVVKKVVKE